MSVLRKDPKPLHVYLFIALNAVDVALSITALSLGAKEINLLFAAFQNPVSMIAVKMILVGTIVLGLVIFRRVYLLHLLNAGMTLVVFWNVIAVLSWSLPLMQ
jgi:hypothetical protein